MLSEKKHNMPADKVLQGVSTLELDQKLGPPTLDLPTFTFLISQFAEQAGVPSAQVQEADIHREQRSSTKSAAFMSQGLRGDLMMARRLEQPVLRWRLD